MDNNELLTLFHNAGNLKRIKRAGWQRAGIPHPESVADHGFRLAFMAMVLGDKLHCDSEKLLKMAILHDIAECMVGDITPHDGMTREEKQRIEKEGLIELFHDIPDAQTYLGLWMEYEEQERVEARIVKDLDKLEMVMSAIEYQEKHPDIDLSEFWEEGEGQIWDPTIMDLLLDLKKQGIATSQ